MILWMISVGISELTISQLALKAYGADHIQAQELP